MKDAMTYKGYIGLVRYSADDEVFHGKIDAINDLIMFEGASVQALKKAFHEAVDDYKLGLSLNQLVQKALEDKVAV